MITQFIAVLAVCGLPTASADAAPKADTAVDVALTNTAIQIYDSYRENRPELDARWAALKQIEGAWRAAGCPSGDRDKLVAWLQTARIVSQPDSTGMLPDAPTFTPDPKQEQLATDLNALENLADAADAAEQGSAKPDKTAARSAGKSAANKGAKPPVATSDKKPALDTAAKSAHGTSLVGFMRNVIKKLASPDEPDTKPASKPAGK